MYDEDDVLDPREKARRDREKQLQSDLSNAADLLGAAALGGTRYSSRFLFARLTQMLNFVLFRNLGQGTRQTHLLRSTYERGFPSLLEADNRLHRQATPE